jgi:NAD(P)-dependent dehydrogenase (short-subunit alcohol dehydrogenase family)
MRRSVFVSGGSGGIGSEIVRALCASGYDVAFSYNASAEAAGRLVEEIGCGGGRAIAIQAELGALSAIPDAIERARQQAGEFYGFVHVAGSAYDQLAALVDLAECERILRVNFLSMVAIIKLLLPSMSASRAGRIVAISSIAAGMGRRGNGAYSASKAALEGFLGCLVEEVRDRGVTVNWIQPGMIDTPMTAPYRGLAQSAARRVPLRREGRADEVAAAAKFLLSAEASYVHGAALRVDGGLSATLGLA